jgi:hypothetical protein
LIGAVVAVTQFALFAFTLSHSPAERSRRGYDVAAGILGAPLMYLRYVPPFTPGRQDMALIFGLAVTNALLWGTAVSVILACRERRL